MAVRELISGLTAVLLLAALAPTVAAQSNHAAGGEGGTIRGRVVDSATGEPIPEASVFVDSTQTAFRGGRMALAPGQPEDGFGTTDEQGRFTLSNVPPGKRVLTAVYVQGFMNTSTKHLEAAAGQTIEDVELRIRRPATVAGRVFDDKGEPLQGAVVQVVVSEYHAGKSRPYLNSSARTNEEGEYELKHLVPAGRKLRLMATWFPRNFRALAAADAPIDPKQRRPAYSRVFYPGAPDLQGGTVLELNSGERREGIDFQLWREPSLCIEGKIAAPSDVSRLRLVVNHDEPSFGSTRRGGASIGFSLTEVLEGTRDFRICGLARGSYRLYVHDEHGGAGLRMYGTANAVLTDQDVKDVEIVVTLPWKIPVRVEWADRPPREAPEGRVRVLLRPLTRNALHGEQNNGTSAIPGDTALEKVPVDEYTVSVVLPGVDPTRAPTGLGLKPADANASTGLYVKDIRYGNESVFGSKPLRAGSQPTDTAIRVMLGHDAGTVSAKATDGEGKATGDAFVYLLPMDARDEADLADRLIAGQTDQQGVYTWPRSIPPGTYRALATRAQPNYTPEFIDSLWRARSRAPEFQVAANGSAEVNVKLLD